MIIRFGLIGCGFISKRHIKAISDCRQAELSAVSDLKEDRMQEAIADFKKHAGDNREVSAYLNYQEMLQNENIDVIVITTISSLHAKMTLEALNANKHVILEKPMALSIEEANEIIALSAVKQKKVMVCHQLRFLPLLSKMKEVIASGKIGAPYYAIASIRINRSAQYYETAPWRGTWKHDGGMLLNQGIHLVDLMQWFLGDAVKVSGEIFQKNKSKETEDAALGIVTFKNGARGIIEANVISQPNNIGYALSVFGEKGTLSVEGPSLSKVSRWHINGEVMEIEKLEQFSRAADEQLAMYENFICSLGEENAELLLSEIEGKKALEIIFAMYQSALTNQSVQLPMKEFSTVNMLKEERD
ncbi:Gfo/Idh/MocA family oxidoreductase [Metabacillus dongyingensis]|uniref:Gfo/Idh/MocA family protein n=1 Tax=Metabacillus dongyingensis TaxID=2874282 RepID=UPI003B8B9DAB